MSRFLKGVILALKTITRILMIISYAVILALMLLTVVNVVMRYFFARPNSGSTEWSQILLIVSMICLGHAIVEGRAISVGVLVEKFPKWLNMTLEILMGVLSVAFFAIVGWRLFEQIESSIRFREAYFIIGVPRWPLYAALGVAFVGSALGAVAYVIDRVINFRPPKGKGLLEDNPDLAILAHTDMNVNAPPAQVGGGENA